MAAPPMLRALFVAALSVIQGGPQIPQPRGLVNDFADILSSASVSRMEHIAQDVREKTGGEIAIVTLRDLGGREPSEIALRIGREWKVGAAAAIGDRTRNAGVVILLVPKETSADGKGHCRVEAGQGTEGFITDATSGEICREATPAFAAQRYADGLELVTLRVAQRFAREFNVTLDSSVDNAAPVRNRGTVALEPSGGINPVVVLIIIVVIISLLGRGRGRGGCIPIFLPFGGFGGGGGGGSSGGGFGGGGGGGFGGFGGGGGFGGFGGGGGFSGGGGGSDW